MKAFRMKLPKTPVWAAVLLGLVVLGVLFLRKGGAQAMADCPGSQIYCPGVGCISGEDKCFAGSTGGPSQVFSKETFVAERKANTTCPDGTRTDGPCLME